MTLKTPVLAALTAVILGTPAFAATLDANGDGVLTIEEVNAAFPEINAEAFSAMDVNADGVLDAEEVSAAEQAGLMPATDG
ncbi:hypothetical protein [Shimia sp.]|uniref:hypothetical protein n=1 Tax=Shimia sp. TaxID=1954381 RepID=UPI003297E8BB